MTKLTLLALAAPAMLLCADLQPINDLPNPFRTTRDWAQRQQIVPLGGVSNRL